ncbi:hypothetical protein KX928_12725 [Roseobacter sp. YSTF-M11]|uniref:Chromosomal replication initiator DnaA C-terminal domain-containing protein n=1 Tax=Roseobacter insulae TaxID=2859783 RepID=A0A9X1FWI1_9RHOB|nr:helix-turn-helix domain-containing protein [Roseobacter insulae]MBW4708649.1 hypothetical protein [Roseobacter insulae]
MNHIAISDIRSATARHFGVPEAVLTGPSHRKDFARMRYVAFALCKSLTDASTVTIGREFGDRDHTTVLGGLKRLEEIRDLEIEMALKIITERVKENVAHAPRFVHAWPFKSRRTRLAPTPQFIRRHTS